MPGFQGISKDGEITTIGRGGSDASAVAFAKLFEIVHGVTTTLPEIDSKDCIGSEILFELDLSVYNEVDLRDANDLISPLSAAMAIGGGGRI